MKYLLFMLIAIIGILSLSAQQPSVVVDGLRYEKLAEGKAKLTSIADEEQYCQAIIDNGLRLTIPDFIIANDNDSLKVTVIGNRALKIEWMMERFDYRPINVSLPSYLEELGYDNITEVQFVDTLTVKSYYPPITNLGSLFDINLADPFPFGPEGFINKIIIPPGTTSLYSNAPGWSGYEYAEEGMEECDSLPIIKSDRFIEYEGYVGIVNSAEKAEMTLLYKVPAENETELNIPSQIESNGATYTVTILGHDMFDGTRFNKVFVPSSVKRLENDVFFNSRVTELTGLEGVEYVGMSALAAPKLRKLTIPESLTSLRGFLFHFGRFTGCFDELILPSTLTEIEDICFHNVTLKKVISKNPVAPIAGEEFFAPLYDEYCGDLIVPEGSEESYLAQPGWRRFARINDVKYADYITPLYDQAIVRSNGRAISIATASEVSYEIYSSAGVKVAAGKASNDLDIALDTPGVYVVKIAQTSSSAAPLTTKIAIR